MKILFTNSCLHTLLPPECSNEVLSKLHKPLKYPVPYSRTKRYQPFLNYAVAHFQNNKWISVFYSSFYVVNCVLYNVYFISCHILVFYICLYCSFYVVYVLPIQLLSCHNYNKHLSCQTDAWMFLFAAGRSCLRTLVHWNTRPCTTTARDGRSALLTLSTRPLPMLLKQWSSTTTCRWMVSPCDCWLLFSSLCVKCSTHAAALTVFVHCVETEMLKCIFTPPPPHSSHYPIIPSF